MLRPCDAKSHQPMAAELSPFASSGVRAAGPTSWLSPHDVTVVVGLLSARRGVR